MLNLQALIICAAALIICYFIGNISPATIMGRLHGVDIRKSGSGNPGTTNVLRTLGVKAAACTLVIDILKGTLPVLAGTLAAGSLGGCACGTAAFLGHIWPVCYRFKGGKGIATGFGVIVAFNWKAGLICLAAALLGAAISRRMSVGSITAAIAFPVSIFFLQPDYLIWSICLAAIVIFRHHSNIARLIKGEEPAMSFSKKSEASSENESSEGQGKEKGNE